MKKTSFIFAIIFAVFGALCGVSYLFVMYWHLGLFAITSLLISSFFFFDNKVNKDAPAEL